MKAKGDRERVRNKPVVLGLEALDELVALADGHEAWEVHFYLGSLLSIQFGPEVSEPLRSGGAITSGLTTLSLRSGDWSLESGARRWMADVIDAEDKAEISALLIGRSISALIYVDGTIRIELGAATLVVETAGEDECEYELALSNGNILQLVPGKGVLLSTSISKARRDRGTH